MCYSVIAPSSYFFCPTKFLNLHEIWLLYIMYNLLNLIRCEHFPIVNSALTRDACLLAALCTIDRREVLLIISHGLRAPDVVFSHVPNGSYISPLNLIFMTLRISNSMAYGTRRFNAAFTRDLQ